MKVGWKSGRLAFALCLALLGTACGDYAGGTSGGSGGAPGPSPAPGPGPIVGGPSDAEMQAASEQTVQPLLVQYCVECHAGQGPGSPHIASPDPAVGYRETWYNQKVNLAKPPTSRLVRRLVAAFHHCRRDCVND